MKRNKDIKIGVITHSIPGPHINGGPMTVWAIAKELAKNGIKIKVVSFMHLNEKKYKKIKILKIKNFPDINIFNPIGIQVSSFIQRIKNIFDFSRIFRTHYNENEIVKKIEKMKFDALLLYHWEPMSILKNWKKVPKMGIVGDPWHHPRLKNWQNSKKDKQILRYWINGVKVVLSSLFDIRTMTSLMNNCNVSGSFQSHEVNNFKRYGVKHCKYYRTPLIETKVRAFTKKNNSRKTILIGPSNLEATSTRHGLIYFAEEIYPELCKIKHQDFQVRIVGEGVPPHEIVKIMKDTRIQITGRIEPPDHEFRQCALQLVPTPFVLGIRVRIISGMNYGACIIAHKCESYNIPELQDGINCLLAGSGREFAEKISKVFSSRNVKHKISRNAKNDFEKYFKANVAVKEIEKDLREMIKKHRH